MTVVQLADDLLRVLAPNPGPMTLDGTNTYVVGGGELLVVDPGPAGAGHHDRVLAAVAGRPVTAVVLTHMHPDHSEGAWTLADSLGVPVLRAADGSLTSGQQLADGLLVLATPGHTADSVCLVGADRVFTGDTVLGRGTTVVAHPDGALGPYLASLHALQALGERQVLPGHGPPLDDLAAVASAYLAHRHERLAQVRDARAAGAKTVEEIVQRVYADVDRSLWPAAALSVAAQMEWLQEHG